MDKNKQAPANGSSPVVEARIPRSLALAQRGIKTGADFSQTMSALMSDLIEGAITPQVGNAVCNAGGKLLKVVEMQYKYGNTIDRTPRPDIALIDLGSSEPV